MSAQTIWTQASTAISASGNSGPLTVGNFAEIAVDVNITAKTGTTPTVEFFVDRLGVDGIYYNIYDSGVVSNTAPTTKSDSIGAGLNVNKTFAGTIQFRWVIGGSASPGYTYSVSLVGK